MSGRRRKKKSANASSQPIPHRAPMPKEKPEANVSQQPSGDGEAEGYPPTAEPQPGEGGSLRAQAGSTKQKRPWYQTATFRNWLMVTFSGGLLLTTTIYSCTSCLQLSAMNKQVEIAQRSLETGQRAWLTIATQDTLAALTPDQPLVVELGVKNTGQAPAIDIRTFVGEAIVPVPLPPRLSAATISFPIRTIEGESFIAAGTGSILHLQSAKYDAATVADIGAQKRSLMLMVRICYADDFRRRILESCFLYRADSPTLTRCPDFRSAATAEECIPVSTGSHEEPCEENSRLDHPPAARTPIIPKPL